MTPFMRPRIITRRTLRTAFASVFFGTLCWATQSAAAQSCHAPSLRPTESSAYRASLAASFASFGSGDQHGEYQGLFATFNFAQRWLAAELSVPAYRLSRTGQHVYGMGDVALDARAHLYRSSDDALIAGPELAAMLPTGSADDGLGMGHVMLMPGAFAQFQHNGLALIAQLAYGRALASKNAHHHEGPMPLVNPMNRSEITHAFGVSAALSTNLRVMGRWLGAVHAFDHTGSARELVAPGLQFIAGAFDLTFEFQIAVLGAPFTTRSVMSVGAQW